MKKKLVLRLASIIAAGSACVAVANLVSPNETKNENEIKYYYNNSIKETGEVELKKSFLKEHNTKTLKI